MSDAEQRAQRKKRARRDFDDEDYEEPAQPRRVSARRQVGRSLDDPTNCRHEASWLWVALHVSAPGLDIKLWQEHPKVASIKIVLSVLPQAAVEAQATARKGMLRGQPSDKRKLNQKGIQRIDSMQFGGVSPPSVLTDGCSTFITALSAFSAQQQRARGVWHLHWMLCLRQTSCHGRDCCTVYDVTSGVAQA